MKDALQQPDVLVEEYKRRIEKAASPHGLETERKQITLALKRVKAQEDRLTDAYLNEAMELDRYKAEMEKLKGRRLQLDWAAEELNRRECQERDSRRALEHLERFCRQVSQGLETLTFEERQQLLRLVVERITVDNGRVRIETIIPTGDDGVQLRTRRPKRVEA